MASLGLLEELVIDSFACGGGTSEGIERALGRSPDIAVNHARIPLAMYRANHPTTRVMLQDVATVDAVGMCQGRPIGMLWMSPDCTDHSKAKGAAPRRDGEPIIWPERTHGNPNVPEDAARIAAGELKTWPIIADCIDFTLPIPSVLDSKVEIKAKLGLNAKRPLAPNTERRLAKGVLKRVLQRKPFIVKVNHTGRDEPRDRDIDLPLSALTGKRDDAIVLPFVAWQQQGGGSRDGDAPAQTFTASPKDQNAIVVPYLVPRYGERPGQEPRHLGCDGPGPTPVPDGNEGSLVCAFMAQHSEGSHPGQPSRSMEEPASTITVKGIQQGVVACSMLTMRGSERRTAGADEPGRTISAGGQHSAVVTMPLMTVYYGSDEVGGGCDAPSRTDTAKARFGLAAALASAPPFGPEHEDKARRVADLLRKYDCWDEREFVTVEVDGFNLVLVDLCLRMLTPRERYNAMGFPPDYIIDHGIDADGSIIRFTLEQQGHMCGNAVCPTEARDLVAANYRPRERKRPGKPAAPLPFFMEAAE